MPAAACSKSGKVPEYTAIASPRKNGREVVKTTALSTGKIEKITSAKSEGKSRDSSNFKSRF